MHFSTGIALVGFFKILIYASYLLFISFIVFYNLLYISRTLQANKQIGLRPPDRIDHLAKASIGIALFTAVLIGFLLVTRLY